jgi:hypothetical protein
MHAAAAQREFEAGGIHGLKAMVEALVKQHRVGLRRQAVEYLSHEFPHRAGAGQVTGDLPDALPRLADCGLPIQ